MHHAVPREKKTYADSAVEGAAKKPLDITYTLVQEIPDTTLVALEGGLAAPLDDVPDFHCLVARAGEKHRRWLATHVHNGGMNGIAVALVALHVAGELVVMVPRSIFDLHSVMSRGEEERRGED
jgi:hypothetical protein